jgi:hypothetical protein
MTNRAIQVAQKLEAAPSAPQSLPSVAAPGHSKLHPSKSPHSPHLLVVRPKARPSTNTSNTSAAPRRFAEASVDAVCCFRSKPAHRLLHQRSPRQYPYHQAARTWCRLAATATSAPPPPGICPAASNVPLRGFQRLSHQARLRDLASTCGDDGCAMLQIGSGAVASGAVASVVTSR